MKTLTSLLAIALLQAAPTAFANEILDAWWPEIGNGLVELGVHEEEARRIFLNMDTIDLFAEGPGSWVYELKNAGDVYRRRAQELELTGNKEAILLAYKQANALYTAAKFPALFTPARKEAFRLQIDTFLKIVKKENVPLEVVNIPFEGKQIVGHFYSTGDSPSPVILWSGGTDGWKMSGLDFKQTLLKEGFSIFAMDLPGTGESQYKLGPDADRIYDRAVEYLMERDDVDTNKIALYFGSFSGVFAVHLALTNPNIAASVNHSGGIHKFFTQHRPRGEQALPPLTTSMGMRASATINAFGLDVPEVFESSDRSNIFDLMESMSLVNQGILKKTPDQAPLLSIYGTADVLMPIEDWDVLQKSGVKSEGLIYEGDRHMAWEHAYDHRPKMIAWLKKQLSPG